MGKKEKLFESAKNSVKNFKFNDLIKLAEYYGFVLKRQKGSHTMMKHTKEQIFMNFQDKNGEAKPYQVKQLLDAIEEFNL
jgi:hypothetical protein